MKENIKYITGVLLLIIVAGLFFPLMFGFIKYAATKAGFFSGFMDGIYTDGIIIIVLACFGALALIVQFALKLIKDSQNS